jgi:hypothetical protein
MEININDDIVLYSEEDHELVAQFKWRVNHGYCTTKSKGKMIRMHRLIMGNPDGMLVDHINNNKLDNQRMNLRITNAKGNGQNKSKKTGAATSQYIGVSYHTSTEKYRASITLNKRYLGVGTFDKELTAARARDHAMVHEMPNSLANLNFPCLRDFYLNSEYIKRVQTAPKVSTEVKCEYADTDDPNVIQIVIKNHSDLFVTIDKDDYETIKFNSYTLNVRGYVMTNSVSGGYHLLHRRIMNIADPKVYIDHIDNNPLNNTKSNLRVSNAQLNGQNKKKRSTNCTSNYMGVYLKKDRKYKKWASSIRVDGRDKHLGYFRSERAAALTRDVYIMEHMKDSHYPYNFCIMNKEYLAKLD